MAIQIKRGTKAAMQAATLLAGEPAWATDTHQLFIGNGGTNYEVPTTEAIDAAVEAAVEDKFDSELVTAVRDQIFRMQTGSVTITPDAIGVPKAVTVNFAQGRFSTVPQVFANALTSVPGTTVLGVSAVCTSTSNATIYLTRKDLTPTTVCWLAIQAI